MYEIIKTDFIKYKYLILINANTLTKNYYTTYKLANEFYNVATLIIFGKDNANNGKAIKKEVKQWK